MKRERPEILVKPVEKLTTIEVIEMNSASAMVPSGAERPSSNKNTVSARDIGTSGASPIPIGTQASAAEAAQLNAKAAAAMQTIEAPAELADFLEALDDAPLDNISDEQALLNAKRVTATQHLLGGIEERLKLPGKREPGNALIAATWAQSLQEYKEPPFSPKWMQVRQLPGYLLSQIRRLGRDVFAHLGATVSLEDIQVMTEITHPSQDVKKMAAIIHNHGQKMREERLTFSGIPCDVQVWRFANFDWVIVEDFGGHYVYGWPENLNLTNESKAANAPRLGRTRQLR